MLAKFAPQAAIFTLDLDAAGASAATVATEAENVAKGFVGNRFRGTPEENRIVQLFGDSRSLDFGPWSVSVDLVLIDGGHSYECASSDTRSALQIVGGNGVIVWDDYMRGWPVVVQAVDEAPTNIRAHTFRLAGTDMAVYDPLVAALWDHSPPRKSLGKRQRA